MKSDPRSYRLSFTVGGLLLHESVALAEAWVANRDWRAARAAVPDNRPPVAPSTPALLEALAELLLMAAQKTEGWENDAREDHR